MAAAENEAMIKLLSLVLAAAMIAASPALPAPQAFEPQMLGDSALSPAFSPDGQTMLFTRQIDRTAIIMESRRAPSGWSQPHPAAFSGHYPDTDPAFGPDGSYLVFASARPVPGSSAKALTLWTVKRQGTSWGTPVHLPANVNVSPFAVAPSIASDGTLYFMGFTKTHQHQLYRARMIGGAYANATPLSFSSPATQDADPLVAPDQTYVLFVSAGRRGKSDTNAYIFIARASGSSWVISPVEYRAEYGVDSDCCLTYGPGRQTFMFTASRGNTSGIYSLPISALPAPVGRD